MYASWSNCIFANRADFTAVASTASEASLLAGLKLQPAVPALTLGPDGWGRAIRVLARGVFSNTGTPTLTFQARLGSTVGDATLSGTSVSQSAAITTTSGVTNVGWEWCFDLHVNTPGYGSGNLTVSGAGFVKSPAGFASPFEYLTVPASGSPGTWAISTSLDGSVSNFLNLSITWSASSASNTITLKQLQCHLLN